MVPACGDMGTIISCLAHSHNFISEAAEYSVIKSVSASSFKVVLLCIMKQSFAQTFEPDIPTFKVSVLKYRVSTPFSVLPNAELLTLRRKDLRDFYPWKLHRLPIKLFSYRLRVFSLIPKSEKSSELKCPP